MALQAQYSYTPFGERTKIAGSGADADFGFAGMYNHARSGLNLTLFRAYNPSLDRWLSRDPIGEAAGLNLYAYVANSPIDSTDPLGLGPEQFVLNPTVLRLVALGLTIGNMAAGTYSGPGYAAVRSAAGAAMARTSAATGLEAGVLRFSQLTASPSFSQAGKFAGKTVCEVASDLRSGVLSPAQLPVEYISRGGANLIINTRSSLALQQAGVPLSEWTLINRTGVAAAEAAMTGRLSANGLTNAGTSAIRITGIGRGASNLTP